MFFIFLSLRFALTLTDVAINRKKLQYQLEDFWANGAKGKALIEIADNKFMNDKGYLYVFMPTKLYWKSITRKAFDKMIGVL